MDFYFCNNLARPDFLGALIIFKPFSNQFVFKNLGYPYLSFDCNNMNFVFKIYDDNKDNLIFKSII